MELASSIYACTTCSSVFPALQANAANGGATGITASPSTKARPLTFPGVLFHPCLTRSLDDGSRPVSDYDRLPDGFRRTEWSCASIVFDRRASEVAGAVISASRLNQGRARAADMDNVDPSLVCQLCPRAPLPNRRLSWREAVRSTYISIMSVN